MTPDRNALPRLVTGLAILALGVIFWLDRLGTIEAREYLRWWPIDLVAIGLAHLLQRQWVAGAIWTLIGGFFLLRLFGISRLVFWQVIGLWPLLISVGGATLVLQALRRSQREPSFRAVAVMAGNVRRVGSQTLTGGEAVAVMGACDIDLTEAQIAGEAVIDVLAFWGGVGIRVPRGWRVIDNVAPIFGGYDDKTTSVADDDAPRLVIRGVAIMGGIEVKHPEGTA